MTDLFSELLRLQPPFEYMTQNALYRIQHVLQLLKTYMHRVNCVDIISAEMLLLRLQYLRHCIT
jgi:hypothetical protein